MCALKTDKWILNIMYANSKRQGTICDCIWTGLLAALGCHDVLLQMSVKDAESEAQPIP